MRLKLLVLILLVALAFLFWQIYPKPSPEPTVQPQKMVQSTTQVAQQQSTPSAQKSQPATETIDTDQFEQQLIAQLSEHRYSKDLVVEMVSIGFEYEGCGNQDTDWLFQNKSLNKQQQTIKSAANNNCDELAHKYPFLTDKKLLTIVQGNPLNFFPATTDLGQYIQQRYPEGSRIDVPQEEQILITLALQAGNAQMLMSAELISSFGAKDQNLIKSLLGSNNQSYFKALNSIALISLSCQYNNGITCTPTAKFMAYKCYVQDQFCGLNFQQWYELSVTPGVAKDVELLKQYYLRAAEL